MKLPRPTLSLKILLVAFLNIVLLAGVFLGFARSQFRLDLSSFILAPARDRMLSVSRLIALQLISTPRDSWTQVLDQYSSAYPSRFYLFNESGEELAGHPAKLPQPLMASLQNENRRRFRHEWEFGGQFPPQNKPGQRRQEHGMQGQSTQEEMQPPPPRPGESVEAPPPSRLSAGQPPPPGLQSPERRLLPQLNLIRAGDPVEYWANVHIPLFLPRSAPGLGPPMHAVLVWRFSRFWSQPFFFDLKKWLEVVLAIILVSVVCWIPLVSSITRAITQLTAATGRIAEGHFEIEVATSRKDELGRLSDSISRMAQRLSGLVHGQRRFLSDIAHELSSPIARAQFALAILEQRSDARQTEYVSDVREEIEHMSGLVSELLAFSKSQSIDSAVELTSVNVADTIERVLQREGADGAEIETRISAGTEVLAQPEYLFRSLANLVRNAVRYASHAGPIIVSAAERDDEVVITVADHGPGLPDSELENVFRPFYRPEFARQRETGGAGLGLAIVRSCVEACGGAVSCRNRAPNGLEVTIRLTRGPARTHELTTVSQAPQL